MNDECVMCARSTRVFVLLATVDGSALLQPVLHSYGTHVCMSYVPLGHGTLHIHVPVLIQINGYNSAPTIT